MEEKIYRLDFRVKDRSLINALDLRAQRLGISRSLLLIQLLESEFALEIQALKRLEQELEPVK